MSLRYFECFAGAGGLSLGLDRAGLTGVGHAEIAPHARAVLRERFPDVPLWGDVTALDGAAWRGTIDLLSGGSPCQDLSVAGLRAGIMDGARSSLFFHQVRLWHASEAPYFLWENVHGALNSHHGRDFALVLGAIVGADVAIPSTRGRAKRTGWPAAGRVVGPAGVAAWRVFDLQHFGPPQRRRRVFVVAVRHPRAASVDPAQVLALRDGVCGHPPPRRAEGQDPAGCVTARTGGGGKTIPRAVNISDGKPVLQDVFSTLQSLATAGGVGCGAQMQAVLAFNTAQITSPTNRTPAIVGAPATSLDASGMMHVMSFHLTQDPINGEISSALGRTSLGMGVIGVDLAPTLGERDYKGPGSFHDGSLQATVFPYGRPRRLMPVECERLMGWPDGHTAYGIAENGRRYALKDGPRYQLCGNGVGAPVAHWIGARLQAAHDAAG